MAALGALVLVPAAGAAEAGQLEMAGYNAFGTLGNGTTTDTHGFAPVPGLGLVTAASGDADHTLALLANGTVMAWGSNNLGELGNGNTTEENSPVAVSGLSNVVAVAAGFHEQSLALVSGGTVWAWGSNVYGQLGDGSADNLPHPAPVQVPSLSNVVAISAGYYCDYALLSNGTVMAWGHNSHGELGNGNTTQQDSPVPVSGLSNVAAISGGFDHYALALESNGTVMAWGYNGSGELGDGTTTEHDTPEQVPGLSGVKSISAGGLHAMALESDGTVMTWGENIYGQLGDGTVTNHYTPEQVPGLSGVTAIGTDSYESFAALSDGSLKGWGDNGYGELGDGTTSERNSPAALPIAPGVYGFGTGDYTYYSMILEGASASLSPAALAFGPQAIHTTSTPRSVTFANAGPAPVAISGETLTGPGAGAFKKVSDGCGSVTLPAHQSCTVTYAFAPSAVGAQSASLSFSSSAGNALPAVALSGTGTPPPPCVVPKLAKLTKSKAAKALKAAHCRLGKVAKAPSKKIKKNRVISSSPRAGKHLVNGAKVRITISTGKPKKKKKKK